MLASRDPDSISLEEETLPLELCWEGIAVTRLLLSRSRKRRPSGVALWMPSKANLQAGRRLSSSDPESVRLWLHMAPHER